ncbi:hypothetical protein Tco_0823870 [Tanacetum coccineum]|uniref:Integrase, catalytic region, zinc finger, CCHC-type, peptidase aspartic, catalytic n=1 Tax=Tanacetum coccineum TaxID=301880 RepID=A0ABQ5AN70_9ASTR
MSSMQEDIQCAGSDTRPPMLDRTDFESWQQRIRLYCLGKDNGENIMKSIKEGPFQMGTVSDVITGGTEGAVQQGPVRARVLNDLSAEEKERYKADIRATNILLQGIPKDIYSLINHYTDAKDIWENVKMILEGSELTKDDRESQLYDEFEHFHQIKGETIQGYYVRFTKLINDMRNIKMTMPRMQLNSKFVNNMLPEWSRFITEVKLNRGLKESNFDQLYAYLKQHEVHANENRMMTERFSQPNNDPLALVSDASVQQYPTQSSKSPQSSTEPYPSDNFQMDLLLSRMIKYQIEEYTEGIVHDFERRLETIWDKSVNRVHILDFEGLTPEMRRDLAVRLRMVYTGEDRKQDYTSVPVMGTDGFRAYWTQSERIVPDKGDFRDYWIKISSDRDFLEDRGRRRNSEGRKSGARRECAQEIPAPAPAQGPPPPPPAPQPRTMSQRIERIEEDMRDLQNDVIGLLGVVESFTTEQSRVSTWLISCMTQLMDASGHPYQAFDSTLVGSSRMPYQRRVRPRTGDASTSVAPHAGNQPDPCSLSPLIIIFCGSILYITLMKL